MNKFLNDFFYKDKKNEILTKLEVWSEDFWKIDCENAAAIFAQRGYEDKGHGHIKRIISNVWELLEKYCEILYRLNNPNREEFSSDDFKNKFINQIHPNLIMFYIAAYLHDIGMNFAGIYKALSDLVAAGGDSALHIGEIIHDYHHYATFIILLEINYLADGKPENEDQCPYLYNIYKNDSEQSKTLKSLNRLKNMLSEIYKSDSKELFKYYFKDESEFCVVLAILCLLHKEVNSDYVQSILRKFKTKKHHEKTIHYFNKWWSFLLRAKEWTEKFQEWLPYKNDFGKRFSGGEDILLMKGEKESEEENTNKSILDLLLVEALLQYGDKTEITIARLAREQKGSKKPGGGEYIPLKNFARDTEYDNQKGFICTDMAQKIISSFARFRACRYIPLILVEVREELKDNQGSLDIFFHYLRFENDGDIFRILRYYNEKDFYDLGFLEIVGTHIPLLLDHFGETFKKNPIFNIQFKKTEHRLFNLKEELINLYNYFLKTSKSQQEVVQQRDLSKKSKESQFQILETELKKMLVDFLNTEKIKEIIKGTGECVDKEPAAKNLSNELHDELKKHSENYLNPDLEIFFTDYLKPEKLEEIIRESSGNKESPEYLMACIYFEFTKQLVYFLIRDRDGNPEDSGDESKTKLFVDQYDNLKKKLDSFPATLKGIKILIETIYKESMEKIDTKDRFPYTPQNRKAIVEYSKSILDPEEKKKTEGVKKVFYETGDLIVPSSFEVMTILNLFYEEE